MYSVLIVNSVLYTESAYPASREAEFNSIPDAAKLAQSDAISIGYFLEKSRRTFEESRSRVPECRFYVKIYDDSTDVNIFKPMLVQVQNPRGMCDSILGKQRRRLLKFLH